MFNTFLSFFTDPQVLYALRILYYSSFFWVPAVLAFEAFELHRAYMRKVYAEKQNYLLLEIKAPRDVFKSPKAMEFFINGLFKGDNEETWWHVNWRGQTRPDFSLEIVSIDGNVRFFVRTRKWLKPPIEGNLYSQYPGIEIFEVPDYTLPIKYDPEKQGLWATEFKLRKEDVLPIKTYVDFGMDKDPKEEYKIDPITPFIEYIGQWGKGHQMWLQILVRSHKNEHPDPANPKNDLRWGKEAEKQIKKVLEKSKGEIDKETGKIIPGTNRLSTEIEQETIKGIERKQMKNAYDVGMRFIYTGPKETFVTSNLTGAIGALMNFSHAANLNSFATYNATGAKYIKPWWDFGMLKRMKTKLVNDEKEGMLDAYKHRAYFYDEYKKPYFILNAEELATIFHLPGGVSTTPTYERIQSAKAEAPANLPTDNS